MSDTKKGACLPYETPIKTVQPYVGSQKIQATYLEVPTYKQIRRIANEAIRLIDIIKPYIILLIKVIHGAT